MSNAKLELILLEYGNRLLRVANSQENPTLSDLIETPRDAIKRLMADEFEKMIGEEETLKDGYGAGMPDAGQFTRNVFRAELRQKLEEWKQ